MPYYTFINKDNPEDIVKKYFSFNDYKSTLLIDDKLYVRKLDHPILISFKGKDWTVKNQTIKVNT